MNSSGQPFEFNVEDAHLANSLHVGQGVYANFTDNQVSLDGKTACCTIVNGSSARGNNAALGKSELVPSSGDGAPHPAQQPPQNSGKNKPGSDKRTDADKNTAPSATVITPSEPSTNTAIRAATAGNPQGESTDARHVAPPPCCLITNIADAGGGSLVTARVSSTGQTFQFKMSGAAASSLKVGQAIYANFNTHQVSLDGKASCCQMVTARTPGKTR